MHIVFWQNFQSILQSSLIRELSLRDGVTVTLTTEFDVPNARKNLGWGSSDFGSARLVRSSDPSVFSELIGLVDADCVHIFTGYYTFPRTWEAYRRLRGSKALLAAYSESFEPYGWKGFLRMARSRCKTMMDRHRMDFVLSIGEISRQWFLRSGVADQRIFPFGYFTEQPKATEPVDKAANSRFNIVYVGQLIPRKGLDFLLQALVPLRGQGIQVSLLGDGPMREELKAMSERLSLEDVVKFEGVVPNEELSNYLRHADLHVLPSRFDGWGAVVNEALMAGVPSLSSDACGASCLLNESLRGAVFKRRDVEDLTRCIAERIELGVLDAARRTSLQRWSEKIGGRLAATYFLEIIDYVKRGECARPIAPWLEGR